MSSSKRAFAGAVVMMCWVSPAFAADTTSGALVITRHGAGQHLHAEKAMANVTVSPGRAGPIEIAIQLEHANELLLSADAVAVTLGNPEHSVAPITANAERVGNDQWRVRMSAPLSGRWSLDLDIRITPSDAVNVVSLMLLR